MKPTGHRRRRPPFTLLELIIAVALFLLVTALLLTAATAITGSWQRLNREKGRLLELLALDRAVDAMFSNAVPFTWPDEDGQAVAVFVGEAERVDLAYLHRLNTVEDGALSFVSLQVDDGGRLLALHQPRPLLRAEDPGEHARTSILAQGIDRIEFLYADWVPDEGVEWLEEWDPDRDSSVASERRLELPLAILMRVFWDDGRAETWLRRTAGNSYRECWGNWQPARENQNAVGGR